MLSSKLAASSVSDIADMTDPSVFGLGEISEKFLFFSCTLANSTRMVADMSNQPGKTPTKEWTLDLSSYGRNAECNPSAMNDNFDWQSIGNLSEAVLNQLRKKATLTGGIVRVARHAQQTAVEGEQTTEGGVWSNSRIGATAGLSVFGINERGDQRS